MRRNTTAWPFSVLFVGFIDARYYNKLNPQIAVHEKLLKNFKSQYWDFYDKLLDFKEQPRKIPKKQKALLSTQFDQIFTPNTKYDALNRAIERTKANKAELLRVLDFPALPPCTTTQPNWPPEGWSERETYPCTPGLIGAPNSGMPLCLLSKPLLNSGFRLSILFMTELQNNTKCRLWQLLSIRTFPGLFEGVPHNNVQFSL